MLLMEYQCIQWDKVNKMGKLLLLIICIAMLVVFMQTESSLKTLIPEVLAATGIGFILLFFKLKSK